MVALNLSPVLQVIEVIDRTGFMALEEEWDALVKATSDEPFYRHEYIRSWINNFASGSKLKILTGRERTGRLSAILPLVAERGFIYGLPARQLVSSTNVHSYRFDLIAEDRDTAAQAFFEHAFFEHLAADKSWDLIKITDVPDGGNAWQLYRVAKNAGFPAGAWESQRSPYIPLPSSYGELEEGLNTKFKARLRRRRRRLEEKGVITVERVTGGAELQSLLQACFAMERSGWKGRAGTAATQNDGTAGFYTELAHAAAGVNYLSLSFLKLNGKPIVFHYGLTYGGVYSLIMSSYDESFREFGPGHLLVEDVLKDRISQGLKEFDFLGCDLEWKLNWSKMVRPHHWFFIFRSNSIGHVLQKAKFELIPALKQMLGLRRDNNGKDG